MERKVAVFDQSIFLLTRGGMALCGAISLACCARRLPATVESVRAQLRKRDGRAKRKDIPRPPNGLNSLVPRAHGAIAPFTSYVMQPAFAPSHRGKRCRKADQPRSTAPLTARVDGV